MSAHHNPADKVKATEWAQNLLAKGRFYILDTETTGIGPGDEIIQLGIINPNSEVVLDTLLKPANPIPFGATRVHGIDDKAVVDAPLFKTLYAQISGIVAGETIIAYNADFDRKMLDQTCSRYGLPSVRTGKWDCAMKWYAKYYGKWKNRGYQWQSLSAACAQQNIAGSQSHQAVDDCQMTLLLLKKMAGL